MLTRVLTMVLTMVDACERAVHACWMTLLCCTWLGGCVLLTYMLNIVATVNAMVNAPAMTRTGVESL